MLKGLRVTSHFKTKLSHNFHELTILEMIVYLVCIRPFSNMDRRFFFEGELSLTGQMYIDDRKALFEAIVNQKPDLCFEIGTYTGGGSTYFLASALKKNEKGKLITLESNNYFYSKAKGYYQKHLPDLSPYVVFLFGNDVSDFHSYLQDKEKTKAIFFDGAEDGMETLRQYQALIPYMGQGTLLMAHDWNTEKMKDLRPLIEHDQTWKLLEYIQPPESVGFVAYEKQSR